MNAFMQKNARMTYGWHRMHSKKQNKRKKAAAVVNQRLCFGRFVLSKVDIV